MARFSISKIPKFKKSSFYISLNVFLDLIASLLNLWELDILLKNTKKIQFVYFNTKKYEVICKMNSQILKETKTQKKIWALELIGTTYKAMIHSTWVDLLWLIDKSTVRKT